MKLRAQCVILAFALLIIFSQVHTETALAEADIELLEVDNYEKTIGAGETVTYNWTLKRTDAAQPNYSAEIKVSGIEDGWTFNVTPDSIPILSGLDAVGVVVTVVAPSNPSEIVQNITVTFSVSQNGAIVLFKERNAVTNIYIPPPPTVKRWFFGTFDNPLPAPLDGDIGVFLMDVLVWLLISLLVVFVVGPVVKFATRKTKTELDDIVLAIVRKPIMVLVFTFGIVTSLAHLDAYLPTEAIDIIGRIWGIVFLLVLIYLGWRLFKDILVYYGAKIAAKTESQIDDILVPLIEKVGMVVIMMAAALYFMGYIGIDLTAFVAGGVVISMVIAFAAQETISNFFSGIFIMTDRPFEVGDTIILPDGDWYEVRKVGMRSTQLFRFKDATLVTIPNNKLANEKISNFSGATDKGRVSMTVGVGYGSDPEKVKKIIRDVIDKNEFILKDDPDQAPIVRFNAMGESSIDFFILVRVIDRKHRFDVQDYLNTELYKRFNEEGIDIPFPQRVVHVKQA